MKLSELIKIAFTALWANKLRTLLTALGIIIGTASVISMLAIGNGAESSIKDRITSLGANTITITSGSSTTGLVSGGSGSAESIVESDYDSLSEELEDNSEVSAISPVQSGNEQVIYKENNANLTIYGVTEDYFEIKTYTLHDGALFNSLQNEMDARVIVLGATAAETLFDTLDPIDKKVHINNEVFTVIGILNSKSNNSVDNAAFIPFLTAKKVLNGTDVLNSIVIASSTPDNITEVQNYVSSLLAELHGVSLSEADFEISNSQDTLETLSSVSDTFSILLAGIASISLLVGGIGIMNTMVISITERTKEIGLRKAIGAKDHVILFQFVVESIVLSVMGAGLGVVFGFATSFILTYFDVVTAKVSLDSILLSSSISVLIGLIFGIYPASKAARLSPINALRYE